MKLFLECFVLNRNSRRSTPLVPALCRFRRQGSVRLSDSASNPFRTGLLGQNYQVFNARRHFTALAPLLSSRACSTSWFGRHNLHRNCRRLCQTSSVSRAPFGWPFGHTGAMAPGSAEKKVEKSYLASAVDSINPWAGSRSATPPPKDPQPAVATSTSTDHVTNPFYGQSLGRYPPDCPPLEVRWFHAVDVSTFSLQVLAFAQKRKRCSYPRPPDP